MATRQSETVNSVPQDLDPALVAYRVFTQAHDTLDAWPGEIPDHVSETAHQAYKALIATKATSAVGAVAQIQGHLRWCDEPDNEEHDTLCRIVADLACFVPVFAPEPQSVPMAELKPIATDYHVGRYQDYLKARARLNALPRGVSDEDLDAAMDEANQIFDDLMEGCAGSVAAVMLKAKAAHHWAMLRSQASVMSPRTFAELFAIIAADLEILLAGRAVRS